MRLRDATPADRAGCYEVCAATAADGGDARPLLTDPDLAGDVYAGPYLTLEPDLAVVLDDGSGRVVGYGLAAADTARFDARAETTWWPEVRARHPRARPPASPLEARLLARLHDGPRRPAAAAATHPAHLHVDLLPEAQGRGWGRAIVAELCARLTAAGAPGVHWRVSSANLGATAFYERLGAPVLEADGSVTCFGVRLPWTPAAP